MISKMFWQSFTDKPADWLTAQYSKIASGWLFFLSEMLAAHAILVNYLWAHWFWLVCP